MSSPAGSQKCRLLIGTKIVPAGHLGNHPLVYFSFEVLNRAGTPCQVDSALWDSKQRPGVQGASGRELSALRKCYFPFDIYQCCLSPGKTLKEGIWGRWQSHGEKDPMSRWGSIKEEQNRNSWAWTVTLNRTGSESLCLGKEGAQLRYLDCEHF